MVRNDGQSLLAPLPLSRSTVVDSMYSDILRGVPSSVDATLFYTSCRAEALARILDTDLVSFLASRQHLTPAYVMSFFEIDSARFARCWDRVRRSVALDPSSAHVYLRDSPMTTVEELMSHFGLSRSDCVK